MASARRTLPFSEEPDNESMVRRRTCMDSLIVAHFGTDSTVRGFCAFRCAPVPAPKCKHILLLKTPLTRGEYLAKGVLTKVRVQRKKLQSQKPKRTKEREE